LLDRGAAYIESRKRMGMSATKQALLATGARALVPLRLSIGLLTPTITVWLRKDRAPATPQIKSESL
jgi:hypothetical protein